MVLLQIKVALQVLKHNEITACLVGELALNYHNVPRVLHDVEVCIPESLVTKAASILYRTGLFEPEDLDSFDVYNEYKRGCPRFRSSTWISPPCTFVLITEIHYGLHPLPHHVLLPAIYPSNSTYSNQILDIIPVAEVDQLPWPRLPSLFAGLCRRFLDTYDDVAMIAAEQLVDGMDLDEGWCEHTLNGTRNTDCIQLPNRLVRDKQSRIDDFSPNTVTCFITNDKDAKKVRRISGYE